MNTTDYNIQNPHQLAIMRSMRTRPGQRITLGQINFLPIFTGLRDIKKAARAAKTALINKGIIRMCRRGAYEFND